MLLIPIIIVSLFLCKDNINLLPEYHKELGYIAAWTFVIASITDFLDGYIARNRKIVTVFGSFLDPVADKFLVISSIILLNDLHRLPVLISIILVLRELYITSLRLLALERGFKVPVGAFGKWKTAFQMIGIPMLMAYDKPWGIPMITMGNIFIYLASFFSLYSAFEYSFNLFKKLKLKRNQMLNS
jgi:CDP-diacylglycerol--glycerol-3-phosphate 3-phosphatidyltransferase